MEYTLKAMRKSHEGEEAVKVYDAFRSHAAIARKNRLLLRLLDDIRRANAEVSQPLNPPLPPGTFLWLPVPEGREPAIVGVIFLIARNEFSRPI